MVFVAFAHDAALLLNKFGDVVKVGGVRVAEDGRPVKHGEKAKACALALSFANG